MNTLGDIYNRYREGRSITTDSRAIIEGCIFFALRGESFDGNDMISDHFVDVNRIVKAGANDAHYEVGKEVHVIIGTITLDQEQNTLKMMLLVLYIGILWEICYDN